MDGTIQGEYHVMTKNEVMQLQTKEIKVYRRHQKLEDRHGMESPSEGPNSANTWMLDF